MQPAATRQPPSPFFLLTYGMRHAASGWACLLTSARAHGMAMLKYALCRFTVHLSARHTAVCHMSRLCFNNCTWACLFTCTQAQYSAEACCVALCYICVLSMLWCVLLSDYVHRRMAWQC
jgi:hypothetical protein